MEKNVLVFNDLGIIFDEIIVGEVGFIYVYMLSGKYKESWIAVMIWSCFDVYIVCFDDVLWFNLIFFWD